jgi:hypothetical protein
MAKAEYPFEEVADWLIGVLEQEYEHIYAHRHPMDDWGWQGRRVMIEHWRKTRQATGLRWMVHDYASMPGYRKEWDW